MPVNSSQHTAARLSRKRHQSKRASDQSITAQLLATKQQARRYKKRLSDALAEDNQVIIDQCVEELISLRAEQTALTLRKQELDGQVVSPDMVAAQTAHYYDDCHDFLVSLDAVT